MVHNLIRLYGATEISFKDAGLGILNNDAQTCTILEELNGEFELSLTYPIDGEFSAYLTVDNIILAKPNPYDSPQPFRIYHVSTSLEGMLSVSAHHISYDLDGYIIDKFTTSSGPVGIASEIMKQMDSPWNSQKPRFNISVSTAYNAVSDKYDMITPCNARAILGGSEDSILERYGGEFRYDKWDVIFEPSRGANRGVQIEYGKNLMSLEQDREFTIYTDIYPFYYREAEDESLYIDLEEAGYDSRTIVINSTYPKKRTYLLDLSSEFDDVPTNQEFVQKAKEMANSLDLNASKDKISLTVSFIALSDTSNYSDTPYDEEIHLGDTVTVTYRKANNTYVSAITKCISATYDVLSNKYVEIQLGEPRSSLSSTIADQGNDTDQRIDSALKGQRDFYKEAIREQTEIITGNRGGYIILQDSDMDGYPDRLLVMDDLDVAKARHIWQFNKSGLGFSETGINGDYILGLTMDGHINGALLTANSVQANEVLTGYLGDPDPISRKNYWNLETGEFRLVAMAGATVGGETIATQNYANTQLNNFITGDFAKQIDDLKKQSDQKAETWYQSADPSTAWNTTALKNEHKGDIWYCTNSSDTTHYQKSWSWTGTKWEEMRSTPPKEVFDEIDTKRQVFISTPKPPYEVGDLWFQGSDKDIMTCTTARSSGSYNAGDWSKLNKYISKSDADNSAEAAVNRQTQLDIFNRLTNNGKYQGLTLENGNLYINATYIATGIISSKNGKVYFDLDGNELACSKLVSVLSSTDVPQATLTYGSREWSGSGGVYDPYLRLSVDNDSSSYMHFLAASKHESEISAGSSGLTIRSGNYRLILGSSSYTIGNKRYIGLSYNPSHIAIDSDGDVHISAGSNHMVNIGSGVSLSRTSISNNTMISQLGMDSTGTMVQKAISSSKRYKDVQRPLTSEDVDKLYNITPVMAKYKDDFISDEDERKGLYHPMFIAENINDFAPYVVAHSKNGQCETWDERIMIPCMFQMIKDLKAEIDSLKKQIGGDNHGT